MTSFRVGILGLAGISSKTVIAILNPDSECEVSAIASRSPEKAKQFASKFLPDKNVKIFCGSSAYHELIQSTHVDAVYIPLPVVVKKSWVIKTLISGKHVVIEKPVAMRAADYNEILNAARIHHKFLLDGTMFPHHPRTSKIIDSLCELGQVDRIEANFTFLADQEFLDGSNIRARKDGDPHGCLGDLGWYCIRYALMIFGKLGANVKSAQVVDFEVNKHGVPIDAVCVVRFENGKVLWFHCGFKTPLRQFFEICGSKKSILLDDLVLPVPSQQVCYTLKSSNLTEYDLLTIHETETVNIEKSRAHPPQEVLLWKTFQMISKGMNQLTKDAGASPDAWSGEDELIKQANRWASISMTNQKVIDALMESLNRGCAVVNIEKA